MITLTPEEEAQLRPEYEKYLMRYHTGYNPKNALPPDSLWRATKEPHLSFDSWWRAMADEMKERAKYAD